MPPDGAHRARWVFRVADLDLADHVNNAVYWQVLEERLADAAPEPLDAEIEHRAAADVGQATVLTDGASLWIADGSGEVLASLFVASAQN
jgi:acyl-ACP thioesterase